MAKNVANKAKKVASKVGAELPKYKFKDAIIESHKNYYHLEVKLIYKYIQIELHKLKDTLNKPF